MMKPFYGHLVDDTVQKILMMFMSDKSNADWLKENDIAEIDYDWLYVNQNLTKEGLIKLSEKVKEWFDTKFKRTIFSDELERENLYEY